MQFRQPYDEDYNPQDFASPVGYDHTQGSEAALEASLTEQSFAAECDINNIVKAYERTGLIPHQRTSQPVFADISDAPSFQEAQNIVVAANEAFAALPAKVRERFLNDPARLMEFMEDESNFDEAVKLGLVNPRSPAAESSPEPVAPATETAPAA